MKKFNDIFRDYIGYILSLLVVVGYILTAVFSLSETGRSVYEIIVNSFVIFVLGVLLANTMGHQGLNEGEKDESVKLTRSQHSQALNDTQPFWYEATDFCKLKNAQALRQERERILNFATLRYYDYFDHDGRFIGQFISIPDNELKDFITRQNKAIQSALDLKITHITPTDLITESVKPNDPLARGRSKSQYLVDSNIKDVIGKVATAIFGGVYTASFIGADLGEVAYRIVIAIILLAFGVVKYYSNYRFMVGENKERMVMATHWLKEFETLHNKGTFTRQEATE
jgi:hypothetical protein